MSIEIFADVIVQGLIFSLPVMAVFLTSTVLGFDDLTVEGSFSTGGAMISCLLLMKMNPWVAFFLCGLAGACLGATTAMIHTRLGVSTLLSGICVTIGAFSSNLRFAGSNVPLQHVSTMLEGPAAPFIIIAIIFGWLFTLSWFLRTEGGLFIKACGRNRLLLLQLGRSPDRYVVFTVALANMLTAWSGALFVQWAGFFSITGSMGILIIALAGVIMGSFLSEAFGIALIIGAVLYQAIFAITISLGVDPVWNNLIKAVMIVGLLRTTRRQIRCSN